MSDTHPPAPSASPGASPMRGDIATIFVWAFAFSGAVSAAEPPVDYARDVKPILAGKCYACHGPDAGQRKAKLRLDVRAEAVKEAIVPGNAAESPLFERVASHEAKTVMP